MKKKNPQKRVSLRTKRTEKIYQEHLKKVPVGYCPFCQIYVTKISGFKDNDLFKDIANPKQKVLHEYNHWFIIPNDFPYDDVYTDSHLLVCKEHIESIEQMTTEQFQELLAIKKSILEGGSYNQIVENSVPRRTVRPHYHLHLLNF